MSEKMTSQNKLTEFKSAPYNKPLNKFLRYVKSTFTPRCNAKSKGIPGIFLVA